MSKDYRLRKILLCAVLEMGALMGVPMRPEEIGNLLRITGPAQVRCSVPTGGGGPDDPTTDVESDTARRPPAEKEESR